MWKERKIQMDWKGRTTQWILGIPTQKQQSSRETRKRKHGELEGQETPSLAPSSQWWEAAEKLVGKETWGSVMKITVQKSGSKMSRGPQVICVTR